MNGSTLLINGASGVVGSAAVQLAVTRGARVIGTAGPANQDYVRSLGAEPVVYGEGLVARVRALAPDGVDLALDVAGSGVLPELIELAGGPGNVVTVADFGGAKQYGVHFSRGDDGRALYALSQIGELIESGRFSLPVAQTFPLDEVAEAHRVGEGGRVRGKARPARRLTPCPGSRIVAESDLTWPKMSMWSPGTTSRANWARERGPQIPLLRPRYSVLLSSGSQQH